MNNKVFKDVGSKIFLIFLAVSLLITAIIFMNSRWTKIRDIRRHTDAVTISKALSIYNIYYGNYPENDDNDGEGWDKSNDTKDRSFLEPLVRAGIITSLVFDPKNNDEYYYRYQKFTKGDFDCDKDFVVFQVTNFENENKKIGYGECPDLNWTGLVPNGYTWFSLE